MKTSAEHLMLKVNGLHFNALAQGPPDGQLVLFLHGFPEFADAWLNVMRPIASAGFRTVAVDQRGYSPGARPSNVDDYAIELLVSDVLGFANELGVEQFHLVAHDWGGLLAWQIASAYPGRIQSLAVLSTPHTNAFLQAIQTDEDQKQRSRYIALFRMPNGAAEAAFEADDYAALRRVYQGKVPEELVRENVRRFSEPGALTAALNWYRALQLDAGTGPISVPTLLVWGSEDLAIGEAAITRTAAYVTGPYRLEKLDGQSHWLMSEVPELIATLVLEQLKTGA